MKFRYPLAAAGFLALQLWCRLPAQTTIVQGRSFLDSLPGETTALVRLRNCADLVKKCKGSPFAVLKDHPSYNKFIDEIKKEMERDLLKAREKLGFDPLDLLTQVEGEAVLAVGGLEKIAAAIAQTLNAGGGDPDVAPGDIPIVLIADAGSSAAKVRENLDKIIDFIQKDGARKEVEDFRGGKITTLTDAKEGDKKSDLEKIFLGEMGSSFLVSINRSYLESTMAGLSGGGEAALGRDADFLATHRQIELDSDLIAFFNVRAITDTVRKHIQTNPIGTMVWGLVENRVIGRGLKNLGISGTLREDGLHLVTFFNNGGAREGILGLLDGPPFPAGNPASMVPEDAKYLSVTSLNIPGLYAIVRDFANMAMSMSGTPNMDVEQFVEMNFQIKLKDVIESLGSKLFYYARGDLPKDRPADPLLADLENTTFAIDLKREDAIKDLFLKLGILSGGALQPEKYLDRDLYKLSPNDEQGPVLGLADKLMAFAMNAESVKELIRRQGKSARNIADNPKFQVLVKRAPGQVVSLSYMDESYAKDSVRSLKEMVGGGVPLPDVDVLADLLGAGLGYTVWVENGLLDKQVITFRKKTEPAGGN